MTLPRALTISSRDDEQITERLDYAKTMQLIDFYVFDLYEIREVYKKNVPESLKSLIFKYLHFENTFIAEITPFERSTIIAINVRKLKTICNEPSTASILANGTKLQVLALVMTMGNNAAKVAVGGYVKSNHVQGNTLSLEATEIEYVSDGSNHAPQSAQELKVDFYDGLQLNVRNEVILFDHGRRERRTTNKMLMELYQNGYTDGDKIQFEEDLKRTGHDTRLDHVGKPIDESDYQWRKNVTRSIYPYLEVSMTKFDHLVSEKLMEQRSYPNGGAPKKPQYGDRPIMGGYLLKTKKCRWFVDIPLSKLNNEYSVLALEINDVDYHDFPRNASLSKVRELLNKMIINDNILEERTY